MIFDQIKDIIINNETIQIHSIHIPSGVNLIEEELEAIIKNGNKMIIAGDLNSENTEWNSKTTNRRGKQLLRYAENRHIRIIAPNEETHSMREKADILDIALNKDISDIVTLQLINNTTSDHHPIEITIGSKEVKKKQTKHN